MINYYKILSLEDFSNLSLEEAYKKCIKKYKNLPFYSEKIKQEIKTIKEAYYVLSTENLKNAFDKKLKKDLEKNKIDVDRDVLRNNYNDIICSRTFVPYNKSVINLEKELELKKSKLNINKKNSNYINE